MPAEALVGSGMRLATATIVLNEKATNTLCGFHFDQPELLYFLTTNVLSIGPKIISIAPVYVMENS